MEGEEKIRLSGNRRVLVVLLFRNRQQVEQHPRHRRRGGRGRESALEEQRARALVLLVEAVPEGAAQCHGRALRVRQPTAHAPGGQQSDVQLEGRVRRQGRDRVGAHQGVRRALELDELTGAKTEALV